MPSKTLEKSAKIPAGPVTKESVPSSSMAARMSSTTGSRSLLRSGSSGRNACTASPSSDGISGVAGAASASASSATSVAAWSRSPIAARVASSMPSGFSHRRTAGIDSTGWNSASRFWTRVDSALSGRNAAMSFSCRSVSPEPRADSGAALPSQTSTSARGRSQRSRAMAETVGPRPGS